MLWIFPWPESIKQRLCRYLLEHYLGQYLEQKILLQQLNIDLYNGVVTLNNINLNCNALNDQLKTLNIPFEIINGSVGSIYIYVPWHDLINDNCKLEFKNINVTIRPTTDDFINECNSPTTSDMFSSVFLNSMQTSRQIAENCLKDECDTSLNNNTVDLDENFSTTNLIGLDALTRTIDSVLTRVKINVENIYIRLEHIIERNHSGYLNGIALEFSIKSVKYFDIDTIKKNDKQQQQQQQGQQQQMNEQINLPSITNKKFSIDGLTVYCDEFTIKEERIFHDDTPPPMQSQSKGLGVASNMTTSIYVDDDDSNRFNKNPASDDESNVNYIYTNPIICATFSGIQEIDVTIKQPSISQLQAPSQQQQQHQPQQSTPKLEVNAQFGSIKCFLCPKQVHLLSQLFSAFSNTNSGEKSHSLSKPYLLENIEINDNKTKESVYYGTHKQKPIRGCDQRKFESLMQNDLLNMCTGARTDSNGMNFISLDTAIQDDEQNEDDDEFESFDNPRNQSKNLNDTNDIYYSMLPPDGDVNFHSIVIDKSSRRKKSANDTNDIENESMNSDESKFKNDDDDEDEDNFEDKDEIQFKELNNKKEKLSEQIKHTTSNQTQFEVFVYKIKFTMFSLTLLQENPENSKNKMLGEYMKNDSELYFEHVSSINTSGVLNNKDFLDIRKQFFEACAFSDHLLLLCKPINLQFTQKLDKNYLTITDLTCSIGYVELIEYLSNTTTKLTPSISTSSTSRNFKANIIKSATINEIIKFDSSTQITTEACFKLKFLSYEPTINLFNLNTLDKRKILPKAPYKQININLNRLILDVDISITDRLYELFNPIINSSDVNYYSQQTPIPETFDDNDGEYYRLNKTKLDAITNVLNSIDIKIPNLKVILRFPIAQIVQPSSLAGKKISYRTRSIREQYLLLQINDLNFQLNYYLNDLNKLLQFSCTQINAYYSCQRLADKPILFAQVNAEEDLLIKLIVKINDFTNANLRNIVKTMSESMFMDENSLNLDSLVTEYSIKINQKSTNSTNFFSPFSSTNSHISGKDNHRIINPANKYEMNRFIQHTKINSEILINFKIPSICLLICDYDFLNDLYNCFLNDLLMWEPIAPKILNNQIHINTTSLYAASGGGVNIDGKKLDKFELCKSAILKTHNEDDEDDDDEIEININNRFKNVRLNDADSTPTTLTQTGSGNNSYKFFDYQPHKLCFILNAKSAKLKAIYYSPAELEKKQMNYGEFDLNLEFFKLCVLSGHYGDINKQYVSLLTDKISLAHDNHLIDVKSRKAILYPTIQQTFESLFNSPLKSKELISANKVASCLFEPQATQFGEIKINNYKKRKFRVPMVSLALESNLEPNSDPTLPAKKHVKLALNINNACLNHLFCTDDKFWLLQLIELLNLQDIDINGYVVPIVVTELHLNVTNSSIDYRPLKLDTKALIAFKSLRISSNVAQNSQATLLIFNIEDIYLFLTNYKLLNYDLKRDYVCIANADIFEFRLLINDKPTNSASPSQQKVVQADKKLKTPILDIKIRCNLIQIRTCVDSCFCLIELLSYIGADGDIVAQIQANQQTQSDESHDTSLPYQSFDQENEHSPSLHATESSPLPIPAPLMYIKNESNICNMVEEAMTQSVYGALDHDNDVRNDSSDEQNSLNQDYGSPFGGGQFLHHLKSDQPNLDDSENDEDADKNLIDDYELIDMIPGLGVLPQNDEEYLIKNLRQDKSAPIIIDENHFSKPITKIDVLKAPDTYPCPMYSYCVQEISIEWSFFGGQDMYHEPNEDSHLPSSPPVSLSTTPKKSQSSENIEINTMRKTISFSSMAGTSPLKATSSEKQFPKLAGGRLSTKYDTNALTWIQKGPQTRNLGVCMEFMFHKVKTKIDIYDPASKDYNYINRLALAIGDIEIIDKLNSSAFNKFLFRYESNTCPKHTNSNMIFLKLLCSRTNDKQRLIECDMKLSIQPLRFNIDQDALLFLVDYFKCLFSKQIKFNQEQQFESSSSRHSSNRDSSNIKNEITEELDKENNEEEGANDENEPQIEQQIFIKNFIFSPDLLIRFDFSGKYDKRSDNKLDTLTNVLLIMLQLSNTEIKLKRVCYKRGFLGIEKLLNCLIKEWINDIQKNQVKNLIKGWGLFNSVIQFFEGFTYLFWYPIDQYRKDGRLLFGIRKGSAAFSTCTVLATIELTNRMFQLTKNIAEFFYDLVTPHQTLSITNGTTITNGNVLNLMKNRNIRYRRHPSDIREGFTNAYYVIYEGINDTAANLVNEITHGSEHSGIRGAFGGALRQLPSAAFAPIVLAAEASSNILSGLRNQLKPDEKRDDEQKYKSVMNRGESKEVEDCLSCKIVGSGGLFLISVYLYINARKNPNFGNKVFIYTIGSGTQ